MEESSPISEISKHFDHPSLRAQAKEFLTRHIALIVLAVFIAVGFWVVDDYGISTDSRVQRVIAESALARFTGMDEVWLEYRDRFYGVSYELPLLLLERVLGLDDTRYIHLMRHLITHLFFLVGGFFSYLLAYRLFGSRLLGVVAMLLFLLHPRIYAHSFFNTKDIPFLSMFMICLYLTHRAFVDRSVWRFLVLGVAMGVLINLRIMGITLFVMVLGMQISDLFQAFDKRRVLGLMGVFVLSCTATLYSVSPYLWNDPLGNFVEWFIVFSEHPNTIFQLFRGDLIASTGVNPPEFVPVWMSITTPPAVLVLGVTGISTALIRGMFNPRDVLANTPLRFWFMLVGCFALPVIATIVLSSNVYDGWRQLYFLYAPFCLLGVLGLYQLISACEKLRSLIPHPSHLRVFMYVAVIASLSVAVVAMFSIHPVQYIYFNFLVDRTTPEHLRSQYDMGYSGTSFREAMEHLLERYPSSLLYVQSPRPRITRLTRELFPLSDQHRIFVFDRDADFLLTTYDNFKGDKIYSLVIYNNTIHLVSELSSIGNRVEDVYRDTYVSAVSGDPVIRSDFDIYLEDHALLYVKNHCVPTDTDASFFLHIVPLDLGDLSEEHQEYGFMNIPFDFYRRGARLDNTCIVKIDLPDYKIERIRTGQFESDENAPIWVAAYNVSAAAELPSVVDELRARGADPLISSYFDIYMDNGRLIYFKSPCTAEDIEAPLFVHMHPFDVDDLPPDRKQLRFDSFSFGLLEQGVISDDGCFTSFALPDYEVGSFLTGQLLQDDGKVWQEVYSFAPAVIPGIVDRLRGSGKDPVVRSYFDVYYDIGRLIYIRESCDASDTDAEFFLHVVPSDLDDLFTTAQRIGFDNLDFAFRTHGLIVDNMCIASIGLPDYDIERIRTGQHDDEKDMVIWDGMYSFAAAELQGIVEGMLGRGTEPVLHSYFDVYLDENRLIYLRESCADSDMDAKFFLHILPSDVDDLPLPRRESGFDNLDFVFETRGSIFDGMCVVSARLPDYGIERIRTGQWDPEQQRDIWKEEFDVGE